MKNLSTEYRLKRLQRSTPAALTAFAGLATAGQSALVIQNFDPAGSLSTPPTPILTELLWGEILAFDSIEIVDGAITTITGPIDFTLDYSVDPSETKYTLDGDPYETSGSPSALLKTLSAKSVKSDPTSYVEKVKLLSNFGITDTRLKFATTGYFAYRFKAGSKFNMAKIGPDREFDKWSPIAWLDINTDDPDFTEGFGGLLDKYSEFFWVNGGSGMVGLQLLNTVTGDSNYGWLTLDYNALTGDVSVTQIGFQTVVNTAVVPEPATSVLLLGLGAAGIAAYRRLRRDKIEKNTAA